MQLTRDARLFEILKKDHRTINMNGFLSKLFCGYYDDYLEENKLVFDRVLTILGEGPLGTNEKSVIAGKIRDEVFLPQIPKRKGKKPICLSYKPTDDTERIISDIEKQLHGTDYVTQYFCRMLSSYCRIHTERAEPSDLLMIQPAFFIVNPRMKMGGM